MQVLTIACLALALAGVASAETYFKETFDGKWDERWIHSASKDDFGEWKIGTGTHFGDAEINKGMYTSQDARFYAISSKLATPFSNKDKKLVVSFTVKHDQGIDCGGGYLKLMPEMDPKKFNGDTEYFMMFGPDICGYTKKIHLIWNYKGKNLLWKKEPKCEDDKLTHVYTVILNPDNTYEVRVDEQVRESGNIEDDWDFLPPKEIDDPEDKKPSDWVDEAEMDDPEDKKPEDWDSEPETMADPKATKPDDWDEAEDGKWEAPQIPNPKHKGPWKAKRIPNPAYKGVWKAKQIPNPEYKKDSDLYLAPKQLAAVGFDLWQVKAGTVFDNIIVADDYDEVDKFVGATWRETKDKERELSDKATAETKAADEKKDADAKPDEEDAEL